MARLRGVDPVMAALALVVAATLCHGLMWMAMLPPWQGPDEFSHYAYVERVVAQHSLPPIDARSPNPGGGSPSMDEGMRATGFLPLRFRAPVRPLGPNLDKHGPFPAETPNLPQISAGNLGASSYPPLYYALAVPLFAVPRLDTATARLTAMRLLSVIAGALVVVMTFRLARLLEVPAQTAVLAAALVSLFPIMGEVRS